MSSISFSSATSESGRPDSNIIFPNVGLEILSSIIHLLGVSILSHVLSQSLRWEDIHSLQAISQISWPRSIVVLAFMDSWLFLFATGVLIHGAGMELNAIVCSLGMLSCIVFYTTSKILIYLFLIEKVQVVWSPAPRTARLTSPIYVACLSVVVMYVGVGILLVFGKISYFRGDGSCVIGLQRYASLTLLIYDLFINVLLTSFFLWPLYSARFRSAHIRRVAIRTVWAAMVALTTSCVNILVLTLMHGQQLAWVCLGSCGTDVVVNALVLFWVTGGTHNTSTSHEASGTDADNALEDSNIRFKSVESCSSSVPSSGSSKVTVSSNSKNARDPKMCLESSIAEDQEAQTVASSVDEDGDHNPHGSRNRAPFKGLASMFNNNDMDRHEIQITVTTQLEIIHDGMTEEVSDYKGGLDRPMGQ